MESIECSKSYPRHDITMEVIVSMIVALILFYTEFFNILVTFFLVHLASQLIITFYNNAGFGTAISNHSYFKFWWSEQIECVI